MRSSPRHWLISATTLVAASIAGCGSDPIAPGNQLEAPSFTLTGGGSGSCGDYSTTITDVYPVWSCGQRIQVAASGSGNFSALQTATGDWNEAFPASTGMPRFSSLTQSDEISITGLTSSFVSGAWGGVRGGDVYIELKAPTPTGAGSGSPQSIALHELGHIMGLGNTWDGGGYRTPDVSSHCTSSFTAIGQQYTGSTLCQHLVELYLYAYGARSTAPSWTKHIVTGIDGVPASLTLTVGTSGVVTPTGFTLDRVNLALCGSSTCEGYAIPAGAMTWHSSATSRVTVSSSGSGATLTPQSPGTAIVYASMSHASLEFSSRVGDVAVTIRPPAPSNLSAASITDNSAVVSWVNGDTLAGTVVQYKHSGESSWHAATASARATSDTLSGLAPGASYAVRIFHQRNGVDSDTTENVALFVTSTPPLAVIAYWTSACSRTTSGGKLYNRWSHRWNSTASGMTFYSIRESGVDNPTTGSIIKTGKFFVSPASTIVGSYLVSSTPNNRYFWIQLSNDTVTTPWFPLSDNPLNVAGGCAV